MHKESVKDMSQDAERFSLAATQSYVDGLREEKLYKIISQYPTINNQDCRVVLNDQGHFSLRLKNMASSRKNPPVKYQHIGYGFQRQFLLSGEEGIFTIPFGVGQFSMNFTAPDMFHCILYELQSNLDTTPHFLRCILPMGSAERPAGYIESVPFNTENIFHFKGLIKMTIRGIRINLFDCQFEGQRSCLFIDTVDKCKFQDFKLVVDAILIHYGWISGSLIRDTVTVLFSDNLDFSYIKHHSFYKLNGSKRGLAAIRPADMIDFVPKEALHKERYLYPKTLESLTELSLANNSFSRACTILAESHGYPLEIRASTYSVVLETLKNIVLESNAEKINPIKSKADARALIKDLKAVVEAVSPSKFNNLTAVHQRIEQINQVGNTDSFFKIFELSDLVLSDVDRECLKMRNDFLHGRVPFENERQGYQKSGLAAVVLRMHLLLCALLLKMGGFCGYVVNNLRLRFPELTNEPVYRRLDNIK